MTSNTREKIKSDYIARTDETENKLIRALVRGMLKPKAVKL
jgi:hexokinase